MVLKWGSFFRISFALGTPRASLPDIWQHLSLQYAAKVSYKIWRDLIYRQCSILQR